MTIVNNQVLPADWLATHAWPLAKLNPKKPQNGVIKTPSPGAKNRYPRQTRAVWDSAQRAATAVIRWFPGADGYPHPTARHAAMVTAILKGDYDPRFWRELTPVHAFSLTSYAYCWPLPLGNPMGQVNSAWSKTELGAGGGDSLDKPPGFHCEFDGYNATRQWLAWPCWIYNLPAPPQGERAWPIRSLIDCQWQMDCDRLPFPLLFALRATSIFWNGPDIPFEVWSYGAGGGVALFRMLEQIEEQPGHAWSGTRSMQVTIDPQHPRIMDGDSGLIGRQVAIKVNPFAARHAYLGANRLISATFSSSVRTLILRGA